LYLAPSHYNYRTFGYPYRTNGLGFRERDFKFKKPKDIYRILVFGDSLTFGVGIDNNHRYTYLLEKLLNRDLKASKIPPTYSKIEVLNMGVAGYATDQEHDLIKSVLKFIECDLIIVGFYKNDLTFTTRSILRATTSRNKKK
jgi:lysophospholipase L1-like esterase